MRSYYEILFSKALFPLYEAGLRGRGTIGYLEEYDRNQWLDREAIDALQWKKLQALLRHCWEHVPYYRRQWQALGMDSIEDIRNRADYARLPVLTKQDIAANFADLQSRRAPRGLMYKTTGGSTGVPLRFAYTRESYERRTAVMWRGYGWAGLTPGTRALYLWGGALGGTSKAVLLKDRVYHALFNRRMLDCFAMNEANLAQYAATIARFKPRAIVSYVTPIVRLARWINESGRPIAGVRSVVGAAEALHDFQRPLIEAAFPEAEVFNTYGCREFMLVASECEHHDGLHVNADHLLVELPGAGPQLPAELAITDLSNYGMPFLRYLNGDLATAHAGGDCACGRALPRLGQVVGRKLDMIRSADGRLLPGEFFPHMLKDVAGIRKFQVIQTQLDKLLIKVVPDASFGEAEERYVREQVSRMLGDRVAVVIHRVDEIPLSPSGKHRVTISQVQ